MEFVDLKSQYLRNKQAIDQNLQKVLNHAHFIMGPEVADLEKLLAEYVGVKHCVTVSNGTDSLEIALRALGVGEGDEVITVAFTWISTAEVIRRVGAKPVFVDIDPLTYNIDASKIEVAVTERTKAIVPVSLFGQMPDFVKINAMASRLGISVIEDGAQSFGSTGNGRKSCSMSVIGSTSFFPTKPLGCYGDGGALFTDSNDLASKMRAIRVHGSFERMHNTELGMNSRLDTLQAAILLAKFPSFKEEVEMRHRIGARYTELLKETCTVPEIMPGNTHVYAQYTIRAPDRDRLAARLREMGIPTAVYYPKCLHEQPVFADCGRRWGDLPASEMASRSVLSLPMHPYITDSEQDAIVEAVKKNI